MDQDRFTVWKIEHTAEKEWRWALWDEKNQRVAVSGIASSVDEATQLMQQWLLLMTSASELISQQKP
jgi:hypothetical protein